MSSSMFIERNPASEEDRDKDEGGDCSDTNLVVVYGKKGVSLDPTGIKNLLEEKISSVSVVRITSPTPSMEDEEEKLEELKRLELGSENESAADETASERALQSGLDSNNEQSQSNEDGSSKSVDLNALDTSDIDDEDGGGPKQKPRRKKKNIKHRCGGNANAIEKLLDKSSKRDRKNVIGLSVEAFYTADRAHELVKNVLKQAGVPLFKRSSEHEFQLYVINNDHCYTPYTSPSQMAKKEAAERLRVERQAQAVARKAASELQLKFNKKAAVQMKIIEKDKPKGNKALIAKKAQDSLNEANAEAASAEDDDLDEDAADQWHSSSEETVDSDRDSDLDFRVNGRGVKPKRKVLPLKKARGRPPNKNTRLNTRDEVTETKPASPKPQNTSTALSATPVGSKSKTFQYTISNICRPLKQVGGVAPYTKAADAKIANPKKLENTDEKLTRPVGRVGSVSVVHLPKTSPAAATTPSTRTRSHLDSAHATNVKEFVINKKQLIHSPKGRFTEISTLLTEANQPVSSTPNTPKSSVTRFHQHQQILHHPGITITPTSSKGFTPLAVESAVKNQLPSQISIQTHERNPPPVVLAPEHDKQLDLIDSIVKDELQKSGEPDIHQTAAAAGVNENIPKLVEMLESTEKALVSQKSATHTNEFPSNTTTQSDPATDVMNIVNNSLLPGGDEEITDDFIQHVVQLIEDNKTLKEAVDKEVYGEVNQQIMAPSSGVLESQTGIQPQGQIITMLPTATGFQQQQQQQLHEAGPTLNVLKPQPQQQHQQEDMPKSIIQMTLSNPVAVSGGSPPSSNKIAGVHTPKSSPLVRKEAIQVVRGNGRVITLPPIEAPTTRGAKRRAQNPYDSPTSTSFNDSPPMIMDASHFNVMDVSGGGGSETEMKSGDESGSAKKRASRESLDKSRQKSGTKRKSTSRKNNSLSAKGDSTGGEDIDASESQDDDDPNKLWCICRAPHNNRFMICCDVCEDWFHGSCVSISKAQGLEMERKGLDWTCPKCKKEREERTQLKITDMINFDKSATTAKPQEEALVIDSSTRATGTSSASPVVRLKSQKVGEVKSAESTETKSPPPMRATTGKNVPGSTMKKVQASVLTCAQKKQFPQQVTHLAQSKQQSPTAVPSQKAEGQMVVTMAKTTKSLGSSAGHAGNTPCVLCKKDARKNTIYCSEDCMRKYASNMLNILLANGSETAPTVGAAPVNVLSPNEAKKKKANFDDLLRMADHKPRTERVNVIEKKTGRMLTGANAPTVGNLRKWLLENPTFEVILPAHTKQMADAEKKPTLGAKATTTPSNLQLTRNTSSPSAMKGSLEESHSQSPTVVKPFKQLMEGAKAQGSRPNTPKQLPKYPQQVSIQPDKTSVSREESKTKEKQKRDGASGVSSGGGNRRQGGPGSEPIRLNVRRTLKEQLLKRLEEKEAAAAAGSSAGAANSHKLTPQEIENFVKRTEEEMYNYFNRDTGAKYRAKYRSLMFNIKDRKNHTLFAKICAKEIEPKQLVRMSPDELASQELAQWREQETKHQLEMIKKSELDLLSCNKNYVLKTHKGEEVIETKPPDNPNITLEDVVPANIEVEAASSAIVGGLTKDHYRGEASEKKSNKGEDKSGDKPRDRDKERSHEKRHKSSDRHKEKSSRSKRHSRSRSSSRGRSRERRHKSSSHKDEKRDKEREHHHREVHGRDREKERTVKEREERKEEKKAPVLATSTNAAKKVATTSKPMEIVSLVDQILESVKSVEEAANLFPDKDKRKNNDTPNPPPTSSSTASAVQNQPDSSQQFVIDIEDPSARETSMPIWKGNINMIDVASFHITLEPLTGNCQNLGKFLPKDLDVVGRIDPNTVWEYIGKIKRSPNKEIVIIRLVAINDSESQPYSVLYQYLDRRKRLGVIKTTSPHIKDFYIFPLGTGKSMPPILQTSERADFFEDPQRPDILLGIVIRVVGKRMPLPGMHLPTSKYLKKPREDTFTPPGSPKRRKLLHQPSSIDDEIDIDAIIKAPIVGRKPAANLALPPAPMAIGDDADEPYSPGGGSPEDDVPPLLGTSKPTKKPTSDEYNRELEDLTRRIAAQEMEIAGLLSTKAKGFNPATMVPTAISNITLPSDLPEILAKIQGNKPEQVPPLAPISHATSMMGSLDEEYSPEDAITTAFDTVKPSSSSRLAQLSEAELLSMVPDDIMVGNSSVTAIPAQSTSGKRPHYDEPPPPGV